MVIDPELTIGKLIKKAAEGFPERPAIEQGEYVWTYAELDRETDLLAGGFLHENIKHGSHVGVWASNDCRQLLCIYALLKIGAIPVLLGASRTSQELDERISDTDIDHLVLGDHIRRTTLKQLLPEAHLEHMRKFVYIGPDTYTLEDLQQITGINDPDGFLSFKDLEERGELTDRSLLDECKSAVRPEDTDMIIFTSGSTGRPKPVVTTHFSRANNARAHVEVLCSTESDRFAVVLPIFHCFSITANVMAALASASCVCFSDEETTAGVLRLLSEKKCTIFSAVPTMFLSVMNNAAFRSSDLSSLRTGFIGGSTYPPELIDRIRAEMDYDILPSLGQTEATAGITSCLLSDPVEIKRNTVGSLMSGTEGVILDINTHKPLPVGAVGELCIRGYNVMQCYYKQPELTGKAIDGNGWLHTGDLGYFDDSKNIKIMGRLKNIIIRGGENISPEEIEIVIGADPRVREVKVVGVPDTHFIEEVCACVVAAGDISADEIRRIVEARLAPFKVPKYVLFFDSLPKTATNKYMNEKIREAAVERLMAEQPAAASSLSV